MTTISDARDALLSRKISCAELTRAYLDAAARANPELAAYITLTGNEALRAAREADKKLSDKGVLAPLEGMPFVMKDNILTAGITTTCASRVLEHFVPDYDAAVWEYLKAGGAVMLGKGNMDEFAIGTTGETSMFGAARNPLDSSRVAGGSSGGVAAAVAAGVAVFGIGSDTGGSVRLPAAYCGVYGLRPTYGAVSQRGLAPVAKAFDQISPITLSARDMVVVFSQICHRDTRDATCTGSSFSPDSIRRGVRGLRIGIPHEFFENLPPEIEAAVMDAAKTLERLGAELVSVSFPLLELCLPAYFLLTCKDAAANLMALTEREADRRAGFGSTARRRILFGTAMQDDEYFGEYRDKAEKIKNAAGSGLTSLLDICDCLLTPTSPQIAPHIGASSADAMNADKYVVPASLAGLPALSVPCGYVGCGMPVGMQLIAGRAREDMLLSIALEFESETAREFVARSDFGVAL